MRIGRLGAVAAATFVAAALGVPASADVLIHVDKSAQQMTVSVDGVPRYVWPVSTGGPHYDTPSGTFKPNRMDKDHKSQEYDQAPMPYAMFFDDNGHAIHGTYEKSIGRPVSHGCVRLSVAHAATLWSLVKDEGMSHTKVVLDGQIPTGGALVARRQAQAVVDNGDDDVTGSVSPDDMPRRGGRRWASDDDYYGPPQRYDDGPRYAYRRPYVVRRVYRDDYPPPFPFFFGR